MTVSSETAKVQHNGDDSTVSFPVTFYFLANSHVVVTHTDASNVETTWVEGTQ
jgi:hypothetical protein